MILIPAHAEILVQFHICAFASFVPVLNELLDFLFQHAAFQALLDKTHVNLSVRFDPSSVDLRGSAYQPVRAETKKPPKRQGFGDFMGCKNHL
ncbi:hypothetical protein A247_05654 [Pseudomonas syringae pv. actinidiae ICMP 19099]|uniref:Uncharacterized protein n=1 Tax=Pseudomonas syringae pv. actinidiae ICMP 19096 TaxID=1194405 RepID=A0A656JP42_PSESF|nr:hypothetical protein A246_05387 [Pseudomonas syringae pv. actinidiae ICMP 19098]EPN20679.1 hypothetical protein A248_05770 [Pseudomonas syringae pv. actinidiae ICMP 19100]EPN28371.1 hypothetical protein A247_05654 [Pseudomonas syringae pv. actinidiae ICMP 19099]EPN36530.1 hypothetical protein A243_05834 [Pseudomonas syringae pv. actinidiae ICMP 18883]EPN42287.1 hypothetical protein A245_35285 [Pseudomonas syringae pv. actinidiae ICMP 19096]EPN44920.1 hypothetical protein A242_05607 [Pseudom